VKAKKTDAVTDEDCKEADHAYGILIASLIAFERLWDPTRRRDNESVGTLTYFGDTRICPCLLALLL
jgi:hypothetical protein